MKIAAALTGMDAARTYTEVNSFTLGLRTDQQAPLFEPNHFSTRFRSLINNSPLLPASEATRQQETGHINNPGAEAQTNPDSGHDTLRALAGEIVGAPLQIIATDREQLPARETNSFPTSMQATISSRLIHYEKEEVFFSSSGTVATEDGRELSFSLDLSMQRTTRETLEFSAQGDLLTQYLIDPLVLSFTGGPPTFSSTSFLFDLDCDGREDEIAGLQPGCGFLAFDKNEDGIINSGLELFGPQSGNGFTDLSAFDQDSNLWIDENDPIFDSLSIWRRNDQGENTLQSLKESGVGAISLSHAGTQFTLQDSTNATIGQVTANGIFLTEDGEVRSLQEVDLAIGSAEQEAEEGEPSAGNVIHDTIFSLRILIAMQQMRARLMIAGNRLNNRFQETTYGIVHLNPPRSETQHPDEPGIQDSTHTLVRARNAIDQIQLEPMNDVSQLQRIASVFAQQDSVIRPMLSLDEMDDVAWPSKFQRWKKQNFRLP